MLKTGRKNSSSRTCKNQHLVVPRIRLQKENVRLLGSQADDQAKMEFAATRLEELS